MLNKFSEDNPCGRAICQDCGNCESDFDFGYDEGDFSDMNPDDISPHEVPCNEIFEG